MSKSNISEDKIVNNQEISQVGTIIVQTESPVDTINAIAATTAVPNTSEVSETATASTATAAGPTTTAVQLNNSCNEKAPNDNIIVSTTASSPSSSTSPPAITTITENISLSSTTSLPSTVTSAATTTDSDMNTRSSHPNLPIYQRRDSNQSSATTSNTATITSNWRYNLNFNNIFQEIRPFVQHAQNVNNNRQSILTSWIPQGRHFRVSANGNNNIANNVIQSNNSINSSGGGIVNGSVASSNNDSFVINVDAPINSADPTSSVGNINDTHYNSNVGGDGASNEIGDRQMHNHQYHVHHIGGTMNNSTNTGDDLNSTTNGNRGLLNNQQQQQPGAPHHHHNHNRANNPNENDEESVSEVIAQIPEARALINAISRYTPYILILLAKSCYDHLDGILHFVTLFVTFSHANWVVRQEIGKQSQRRIITLIRELIFIAFIIAIIGSLLEKRNIFISLIFASSFTQPYSLKNLLFSVCITDLILKLLTVAIKIFITLFPSKIIEYKGRGRIYLMTESLSQLYRAIAPIHPWLVYLLDSYAGVEKIMGVILAAAYIIAKGSDLINRAKFCKRSFIKLLQKVSFGVTPTKEQLQETGGQCPICHDSFNSPVLLECNHVFCELCVGQWFDREQTCPLCRAKVVDDPSWRDGATTFFLQFY